MSELLQEPMQSIDHVEIEKRDLLARMALESLSKNILIAEKESKALVGGTYVQATGTATTEATDLIMTLRQFYEPVTFGKVEGIVGTVSLRATGSTSKPDKIFIQQTVNDEGAYGVKLFDKIDVARRVEDIPPLNSIKIEGLLYWIKKFELEGVDSATLHV